MNDQERELKTLITKEQYDKLESLYPFSICREQINTYYDNAAKDLQARRMGLRIRQIPKSDGTSEYILTLKKPLDAITKYEYERIVNAPTLDQLEPEVKEWLEDKLDHLAPLSDFHPTLKTRTVRKIYEMPQAELCLDYTEFAHHSDYEAEYEYHHEHDGIKKFNELLAPAGVVYEKNCPSKLARAVMDQDKENL